jgi:alanyl aminopeptidase
MVEQGTLELGTLLALVPRLAGGTRLELADAVGLAWLGESVVGDAARPAYRTWVAKTFGARARKLGWLPGKKDDLATEQARGQLTVLVAKVGRDKKLLGAAKKLAKKWRALPESVRGEVLGAAVLDSSAFAKKLLVELDGVDDDRVRADVFEGLAWTEDREVALAGLARVLEPERDVTRELSFLYVFSQRAVVATVATWVREHVAELFTRMQDSWRCGLIWPVTATCDASERDAIAAWANEHIAGARGGERAVAQALERFDQCVAQRASLGPQVDAWLAAKGTRKR